MHRIIVFTSVLFLFFSMACQSEEKSQAPENKAAEAAEAKPQASQLEMDVEKIQAYLQQNGLEAQALQSGVHYIIEEAGGEEKPTRQSNVVAHYRLKSLDEIEIESSFGKTPLDMPLARLIEGWQQGIPLVGRGGKVRLFVPSELAYGPQALTPEVGPNSVLQFDIELIDFSN